MAKKLKTGDVFKFISSAVVDGDRWATVGDVWGVVGWSTRRHARYFKENGERIARVLSIGPKYVKVRISK